MEPQVFLQGKMSWKAFVSMLPRSVCIKNNRKRHGNRPPRQICFVENERYPLKVNGRNQPGNGNRQKRYL